MSKPLPPLLALKAFEAAARHLSFKLAAEELCVTPSSVSHQIKKLEDWLGAALFVRFNREVALTQDGKQYLAVVGRAFSEIAEATSVIGRHKDANQSSTRLVVSANSGFIDCWLNARLSEFHDVAPDIDLEIHYGEDMADFRHRDADVAIYFGSVKPQVPGAVFLRKCMEFCVSSPQLIHNGNRLKEIKTLEYTTLLHEQDRIGWKRWLSMVGIDHIDTNAGPVFQNSRTIFDRVEAGDGVALGDDIVAADQLIEGRLVKPFPFVRESDWSVYLLPLQRDRSPEAVNIFCDWLTQSLKKHEHETEELRHETTYPSDWL